MPFFDTYYIILVVPALLLAAWAQFKVKSTYSKYNRVRTSNGITGSQAARRILDANGLSNIRIERVRGDLTDHYDPSANVIRLSDTVYDQPSVAAVGVAAHECGHAIQHATQYTPLVVRNAIIPVTNFSSKLAIPIFIVGLILSSETLAGVGIILFSVAALFQLITLPVEFNASRRALDILEDDRYLGSGELRGSKRVLTAAALTYVAALGVTLAQLLRLMLLARSRNRD